ncbi:phage tail tip lysozyme [Roseomonas sp. BN140053]|uniref:phage tail tip lysozyme n=1 Tax=Roseomonas sp. BN140053 TaxID=3391898 RepID=UPI0039EAD4B2
MATASAGTLSLTLSANDRITAPLQRLTATAQRMSRGFAAMAERMTAPTRSMERLGQSAQAVTRNLTAIAPPLAALSAAGTVAGIARLTQSFGAFGGQLTRDASRVRTTTANLHALQGAAILTGSSAEAMTQGLEGLGDALTDAAGGRDNQALQYFALLKVAIRDGVTGQARTAAEVLPEVADQLARIGDPALRARVMGALRIPATLMPTVERGSRALAAATVEARRYGAVTDNGAAIGARFEQSMQRISLASSGFGNTIAQAVAPSLGELTDRLSRWLATNRVPIGQGIEDAVKRLTVNINEFADSGGFERLGTGALAFGKNVERVVGWMGGWGNAATALGAILTARLVAPLATMTASLVRLVAFRPPVWMLRLLGVGGLALGVGEGLRKYREQRDQTGERQREQEQNFARRGALPGFYSGPAEEPEGLTGNDMYTFADRLAMRIGTMLRPEARTGLLPGGETRRAAQHDVGGGGDGPNQVTARHREAFDYFRGRGWSDEAAAGIVANFHHESGVRHDGPWGDGGNSGGMGQWDATRRASFERWSGTPFRQSTRQQQLDFTHYELTEGPDRGARRAGEALRSAGSAREAASAFSRLSERPAGGLGEAISRGNTAERMLPELRRPSPPAPTTVAPGAPAPSDLGERPMANPSLPGQQSARQPAQQVEFKVSWNGPVPDGARVTARGPNGEVRVERAMVGAFG